jgi:hypothetical protein
MLLARPARRLTVSERKTLCDLGAQKSPDENEVGEDCKRGQTKTMIRITSAKSTAFFSSAFMPTFRVAEQDSNRDHAED